MGGLKILDAMAQAGGALVFMIFTFMAISSGKPFTLLLALACLIFTIYLALSAVDSAVGGEH